MNKTITDHNWNERYLTGDTPWTAHALLTDVLDIIQECLPRNGSILEIGCGYGQEAIALAKLGYDVTAVDLSNAAISQATASAKAEKLNIHFQTVDLFHDHNHFTPFDLVLDIAVLHTIENEESRNKLAKIIDSLLKPQATWINVSCITPDVLKVTEVTGVKAPPALSKLELEVMSKDHFLIKKQKNTTYQILREGKLATFPALISVFEKKEL